MWSPCSASVGPVDSSENLQVHPIANAYSGTVNLAAGTVAIAASSGPGEKPVIHGILMIVGWGAAAAAWGRVCPLQGVGARLVPAPSPHPGHPPLNPES